MNAEDRALVAIGFTRTILRDALNDPEVLVFMTTWGVEPEDLEFKIAEILEYLDKTREEAKEAEV